jgi:RNA-directed DNA polymerase
VAQERVLHYQRKLHEWASNDAECRFHDLWNLVCDPATLVVAWSRVSRNRGSRTAGVDAATRSHVEARGVEQFLTELRGELRAGTFRPLPVRERLIPKHDGRMRRLGIPTLKDRVAQMALKLVMEPIASTALRRSSPGSATPMSVSTDMATQTSSRASRSRWPRASLSSPMPMMR